MKLENLKNKPVFLKPFLGIEIFIRKLLELDFLFTEPLSINKLCFFGGVFTGAFFCCRKDIFENLREFTLAFPNSFQDVDFCLRARSQGMRCLISPHVKLLHFESVTRDPMVDDSTLTAVRQFHRELIAPWDPLAFHRYEKIRVSPFTLTGFRHHIGLLKTLLKSAIMYIINYSQAGPRAPRGVLKKAEWHVH